MFLNVPSMETANLICGLHVPTTAASVFEMYLELSQKYLFSQKILHYRFSTGF